MPGKAEQSFESKSGRGDTIRTCDPLLPKQVLYQAELRPDTVLEKDIGAQAHRCNKSTAAAGNAKKISIQNTFHDCSK